MKITQKLAIVCTIGIVCSALGICWDSVEFLQYAKDSCIYNSPSADCGGLSYFPESHFINQDVYGRRCVALTSGSGYFFCTNQFNVHENSCTCTVKTRVCSPRRDRGIETVTSTDTTCNVQSDAADLTLADCSVPES